MLYVLNDTRWPDAGSALPNRASCALPSRTSTSIIRSLVLSELSLPPQPPCMPCTSPAHHATSTQLPACRASLAVLISPQAQGDAGYDQYGLGTSTDTNETNPDDRNSGNNLPTSVTDGQNTTIIATYPCGGPDLYPDLSDDYIDAFISAILALLRGLDQGCSCEFQNVQLLTRRRSLLVSHDMLAGCWDMAPLDCMSGA